jgi:hypothetical protein
MCRRGTVRNLVLGFWSLDFGLGLWSLDSALRKSIFRLDSALVRLGCSSSRPFRLAIARVGHTSALSKREGSPKTETHFVNRKPKTVTSQKSLKVEPFVIRLLVCSGFRFTVSYFEDPFLPIKSCAIVGLHLF